MWWRRVRRITGWVMVLRVLRAVGLVKMREPSLSLSISPLGGGEEGERKEEGGRKEGRRREGGRGRKKEEGRKEGRREGGGRS